MKHSIKVQFSTIFILLVAGTILLCWFINNTFLEKYYMERRQQVLLHAYDKINDAANNGDIHQMILMLNYKKYAENIILI